MSKYDLYVIASDKWGEERYTFVIDLDAKKDVNSQDKIINYKGVMFDYHLQKRGPGRPRKQLVEPEEIGNVLTKFLRRGHANNKRG